MTATAQQSKLAELRAKTAEIHRVVDDAHQIPIWQRMKPMLTLQACCIAERRISTLTR